MWAECGWSVGQRKAIRQMWVECGAMQKNKTNVGRVQKKVKNGKARGKNNSNVGENTKN